MKTHKVLALVRYSLVNELPREFFAHEIPILQNLNDGNPVRVVNPEYAPGPDMSPRDILIQLRKTYGGKTASSGGNVVDEVFPDGSRDIEAFYKGDYLPPVPGDVQEVLDDGDVFPSRLDRPTVAEEETTVFTAMDRDTAIAKLRQLSVPFSINTPTKHLIALLESSVETGGEISGLAEAG